MFFVAAPVCIAEQAGVGTSLSRSRFLTKRHRWQVFGAAILVVIAEVVAIAVVGALFLFPAIRAGAPPALFQIVYYILTAGFGAFYAVIVAVFYYQLRIAKEGIDLTKIASVFD
jgi:hypothetical protein